MKIFEFPWVIITILVMIVIVMGLVGLYFTIKSVRTAKGTAEKGFSGLGKMEHDFDRAGTSYKNRTLVYVSVPLDGIKRMFSESKAARIHERVRWILFRHLCADTDGEISLYGEENFVATSTLSPAETERRIDGCFAEIHEAFIKSGVVNVGRANFGYLHTSSAEVDFKTALARAKQACSMAVDENSLFRRWDSANGRAFERKVKIENDITGEIDNNRFFLEYQPIVSADASRVIGAEVLSRLNSETEGVLSPYHFLSAVSSVGVNEKFDYYIFEKNCKWIASDRERRSGYVYTINFSRQTLCDPALAETILAITEKYGVDCSCIAVEILEDKSLNEEERAGMVANLARLKEKGVMLLLDDFGSGYTSFTDLAEFRIDIVKIDKEITQNAVTETGFLILKNIVQTAHDLNFKALCEGVETAEHREKAVEAGCDMMQGYYFYRPMPVTQLETLLEKQ